MNSEGPGSRGRGSHAPRGHRPYRGRDGGGGRGRGGQRGGHGRGAGRGSHHSGRGGAGHGGIAASVNDPSLDPQLAPRPPHPGFFHTSFLENPWYDLEEKHGIPHLRAIVPVRSQSSQQDQVGDEEPIEQAAVSPQQTGTTP